MLCLLSVLCSGAKRPTRAPDKSLPTPHHQFFTRIETTAHQLNATSDYPPYKRFMSVHYDYSSRRARIDYEPVPHMPPKSYVRRYDLGHEWMVTEIRSTKECRKSLTLTLTLTVTVTLAPTLTLTRTFTLSLSLTLTLTLPLSLPR